MAATRPGTRTYTNLLIGALSHLHLQAGTGIAMAEFIRTVRPLFDAGAAMWWEYDLREETLTLAAWDGLEKIDGEGLQSIRAEGFLDAVLGGEGPHVLVGVEFPTAVQERLPSSRDGTTTIALRVGSPERPHGVLVVHFPADASLAVQSTETLELLGASLARAMDAHLLQVELQNQVKRLLLLHELSRVLQSNQPIQERLEELIKILTTDFSAHFGCILLFDEAKDLLEFQAVGGISPEAFGKVQIHPGQGITGSVFRSGLAHLVKDVETDADYIVGHPDIRSELAVPIRSEGKVIGVLNLEADEIGAFDEDDLRLASIIANQIGPTIEHGLGYETALSRLNELELVNRITRAIATIDDVNQLLHQVVTEIHEFFDTTVVGILLLDEDAQTMQVQASAGDSMEEIAKLRLRIGKGITGTAARSGKTLYVPDVTRDTRYVPVDPTIRSELAVPLRTKDGVIGILNMESNRLEAYGEEDRRVVEIVAAQIAQILGKALIYQEMQTMAITDGLTGLYNHRQFFERLEKEFKRAIRYSYPLSLIMVDLDYFKEFNDRYGHLQGDDALRQVAGLLMESVRETDVVARYGGEEFAVILPLCHQSTAVEVADRIRETVEGADLQSEDDPHRVTVSVGICTGPEQATDHEELVRRADDAMYASKRAGRNRCTVWNPEIISAPSH